MLQNISICSKLDEEMDRSDGELFVDVLRSERCYGTNHAFLYYIFQQIK